MEQIDFKKSFQSLYRPSAKKAELLEIPPMRFLVCEGAGDPNGDEFQRAAESIYGVAYTVKFGRKKAGLGPDYTLGPLEGLWWMSDEQAFDPSQRTNWRWKLLLWQPDCVGSAEVEAAASAVEKKKPHLTPVSVRLETLDEGQVAQIMHLGPYSEELATVAALHDFIAASGLRPRGRHHEVYLGDPRRTAPERLRTILRQPVERA